ncbi:hypothetical protein [Cellulomonas wangsupingiae]|uniref:Uncharacterized protein n=1 Tax=Cellulomonas wangsupingiae TaxID=2968085 RepID=A0ABY5K4K4_9CELL|nr:hypothetical protein [Cellulomonas wangsupingiae]MCC2334901.1 hypothetical protein [Cellulomonas wangsupingiae]MCM0638774.1 hypothetical protein [Cellulomonas wangsupingiae]UUI65401.1 hypothetical protein NP075_01270 [Cellulomonas wangsupingiae]
MAVRLHYSAARSHPLTQDEVAVARGLVAVHNATFPFEAELLTLAAPGDDALHGTTTLPEQDPFTTFLGLAHWCRALTEVRRALPGTTWEVRVDDEPVPWHDEVGFGWAEQRDPEVLELMEQLRPDS